MRMIYPLNCLLKKTYCYAHRLLLLSAREACLQIQLWLQRLSNWSKCREYATVECSARKGTCTYQLREVSGASQESRKNRKALGRQETLWNTDFWKSHASCMFELTAAMIPCTGSTEDLSVVNRVGLMGPLPQPSQNIYTQLKVGGEEEKNIFFSAIATV